MHLCQVHAGKLTVTDAAQDGTSFWREPFCDLKTKLSNLEFVLLLFSDFQKNVEVRLKVKSNKSTGPILRRWLSLSHSDSGINCDIY